jgi:hydroxypyruvate isomerase
MSGDLTNIIKRSMEYTKHIQIASPPNRYEPDNGEINYPFIFDIIDKLNYQGYIGCEYKPSSNTQDSLGWAKKYNIK